MIAITGKSCSGKDTISKELIKKGYKRLITYTTRPMRKGETDGVEYHFISSERFFQLLEEHFFLETKAYNVANGDIWYYGSAMEDYEKADDKTFCILTPSGIRALTKTSIKFLPVYLDISDEEIMRRQINRGDEPIEAERRLLADKEDFENIDYFIDYTIDSTKASPQAIIEELLIIYKFKYQKPKLYIDLDMTLINSIKAIVDLYNDDYKYYLNFQEVSWEEINSWDFEKCSLMNRGIIDNYFNQPRFFNILESMDEASEALFKLRDKYDITIVTMGDYANLQLKKEMSKRFPIIKFIGCNMSEYNDKSHIDMSDGILIDDSAQNLHTSNAKNCICFGKEYEHNKDYNGLRCETWQDILDILL